MEYGMTTIDTCYCIYSIHEGDVQSMMFKHLTFDWQNRGNYYLLNSSLSSVCDMTLLRHLW